MLTSKSRAKRVHVLGLLVSPANIPISAPLPLQSQGRRNERLISSFDTSQSTNPAHSL